jgi:hypothetical protein
LPEDKIEGLFIIKNDPCQPLEHLRCLQLPNDRFSPCFPQGSILAVDVAKQNPEDLGGRVVLSGFQLDRERGIFRLRRDGEFLLFGPINPNPQTAIRVVEADKVQQYSIIGEIIWAWHPVI